MRPTREGHTGADRPGLIYIGLGVTPEDPTTDPEPPVDRSETGVAYIPFLPPPEPGVTTDLNLEFGTDYDGGGNRPVVNPTYANDGNTVTAATRTSFYNGGGTKTWMVEADLGAAFDVFSIVILGGLGNAGENDPPWEFEHSPDSSTWTTAVGSYVWNNTAKTATLTLSATQNKRYWRVGHTRTTSGFVYPVKVHTFAINGDPGAATPSNIVWLPGPLTNDDSDSSYEYVYDTGIDEFWRLTLDDTYLVESIEARLAFDTAGSNPVIVQGANEADYSDAVTLTTIAVTATGSFTAQDISGSWAPTVAYRYYQLLLTTPDNIRVHEVSLFDPADPTGIHDDLTGRDAADQHPASSVTFTPAGTVAATNVQDAIEEVAAEATGISATIFDAKGDIIAATAADTAARLAAAGTNGAFLATASGESTGLKWLVNKFDATTAPTANDDTGDGYQVGSIWIDVTNDDAYICVDATSTAAVWNPFEAAAGGWATVSSGGSHTTSGGYEYYAFTSSGTLTISGAGILEALVVGGGGGGGGCWSGGGGGGGAVITQTIYLTAAAHTVTVGAGGIAGTSGAGSDPNYTGPGGLGGFSRIADLWAPGGSGGHGAISTASTSNIPMPITASGGGGATRAANAGTAATSGLGFAGGAARTGTTGGTGAGGGGGGASAVGADAGASDTGAAGGAGETVSAFSNFGASGVFAGGGGGGGVSAGGNGGTGGGGHGGGTSANTGITSPTANTGSGGGGGGNTSTTTAAGTAGGTGVVVVRVPT